MIKKLIQFDKDRPKTTDENIYKNLTGDELRGICRKRKFKYVAIMKKQEMIEKLVQFDNDPSKLTHETEDNKKRRQKIREYQKKYRKTPERRRKARECAERWRENNPEKVKDYWEKFRENYERKNPRIFTRADILEKKTKNWENY